MKELGPRWRWFCDLWMRNPESGLDGLSQGSGDVDLFPNIVDEESAFVREDHMLNLFERVSQLHAVEQGVVVVRGEHLTTPLFVTEPCLKKLQFVHG